MSSSGGEMLSWPATLPLPFVDYEGSPLHQTLASGLENAKILRRSRFKSAIAGIQVRWVLGIAEYIDFKTFFVTDLYDGVAVFILPVLYPFNSELTDWRVRFSGGYSASYVDGNWQVEASLDLISRVTDDTPAPVDGWEAFLVVTDESSGGDDENFITSDGYSFLVKI